MITASVLAKKTDVPIYTVRHYTKIGLLKPSRDSRNNYKIYQPDDVILLRFINNAKELGFTLKEISKILAEAENGNSPCPLARKVIEKRIAENHRKIKQMQELQTKMKKAQKDWAEMKDALPNGHSICHLIESIAD